LVDIERQKAITRENRFLRSKLEDELHHAQGRALFWLHRAIMTGDHNGDMEEAFADLTRVEKKIKDHDREIIANNIEGR
jgi:hypothetical protein